ncbi:hypothetical protein Q3G72_032806 [Acer saccharum]|nr:hypothetical protein Q3G72_032806 [Acer saccharum]
MNDDILWETENGMVGFTSYNDLCTTHYYSNPNPPLDRLLEIHEAPTPRKSINGGDMVVSNWLVAAADGDDGSVIET